MPTPSNSASPLRLAAILETIQNHPELQWEIEGRQAQIAARQQVADFHTFEAIDDSETACNTEE